MKSVHNLPEVLGKEEEAPAAPSFALVNPQTGNHLKHAVTQLDHIKVSTGWLFQPAAGI